MVTDHDVGPGTPRRCVHGGVRRDQEGVLIVGRDDERGADRRLAVLVEGVNEPERGRDLRLELLERAAGGGQLLDRLELVADLALGLGRLERDGVLGALEPRVEAAHEAIDAVLVLVEAVVEVRVEDGAAERRAQGGGEDDHADAERRLGDEALAPARR